jgi:hypothetical protein
VICLRFSPRNDSTSQNTKEPTYTCANNNLAWADSFGFRGSDISKDSVLQEVWLEIGQYHVASCMRQKRLAETRCLSQVSELTRHQIHLSTQLR